MKKSSKDLLFERMEYLNPDFKRQVNENLNDNEQNIVNDILSTNEGVGDWWNKFIQYGRKGLLTTAIIFAIATSAQAQQQNKTTDVIKAGIELTQNQNTEINKDLHNFVIGVALNAGENYIRDGKMELFKLNSEVIKFHLDRRNGITSNRLSPQAKEYEDILWTTASKMKISDNLYQRFIEDGRAITTFTYNQVGY
jgi:hypothetical protein